MANSPEKVWLNRIKRQFNAAVKDMAGQMTYRTESAYQGAIQAFYNDYYPKWYQRTYSTYEASDRANDMFGYNVNGNIFESGIHVDPSYISGNPYRADKGWVFERTFVQGIHGFTMNDYLARYQAKLAAATNYVLFGKTGQWNRKGVHRFTAKTYLLRTKTYDGPVSKEDQELNQYVFDYVYGDKKNSTWSSKLVSNYKREKYNKNKMSAPGRMTKGRYKKSTSPKKTMDKEFKELTKKKNMKKMFDDILESHLT